MCKRIIIFKQLLTKYQTFTKLPHISRIHKNLFFFFSKFSWNFLDQLLLPYKFYGRSMKNRPHFLHKFVTECPHFSQLYTHDPLFFIFYFYLFIFFFRSLFSFEIITFWGEKSEKCVKIARICAISHPMTPGFFRSGIPNVPLPHVPLFQIVSDGPLI